MMSSEPHVYMSSNPAHPGYPCAVCLRSELNAVHRVTPPPSELTTGAERPTIAGALSAMLRAKVIRVDQVHHIRAILDPVWDAALAEVQRERDAVAKQALLAQERALESRLHAAEQREREAGETVAALLDWYGGIQDVMPESMFAALAAIRSTEEKKS